MGDLKSKAAIVVKGVLLLAIVVGAALLVFLQQPTWQVAVLLALLVWASGRFYYFLFYVLEKYVDPSLRYSGLLALLATLLRSRQK